jgi:hypothetical protein
MLRLSSDVRRDVPTLEAGDADVDVSDKQPLRFSIDIGQSCKKIEDNVSKCSSLSSAHYCSPRAFAGELYW